MGQITISVVGDGSVGTKSKTYSFTDAAINRLVAAEQAAAKSAGVAANPTVTQALVFYADAVIQGTIDGVKSFEQSAAAAAILPIVAT